MKAQAVDEEYPEFCINPPIRGSIVALLKLDSESARQYNVSIPL